MRLIPTPFSRVEPRVSSPSRQQTSSVDGHDGSSGCMYGVYPGCVGSVYTGVVYRGGIVGRHSREAYHPVHTLGDIPPVHTLGMYTLWYPGYGTPYGILGMVHPEV